MRTQTFFRNNALIGAAEIVCRLPLILTAGYMARALGTEAYGHWVMIMVAQNLIASIACLGMSSSISRLVSVSSPGQAASYLHFGLRVGALALCGFLAATALMYQSIGKMLGLPADFGWLLPVAVAASITAVAEGLLDAFFKARSLISRQLLFVLARTLADIAAVFVVFRLLAPRGDWAAPQLLLTYLAGVLLLKLATYPWLLTGRLARPEPITPLQRREFIHYGLPIVPAILVSWVVGQGDRLVLGQLVGSHELGIYAFGASLASYIAYLGYAVYPLLLPNASRLYDGGNREGLRELFLRSQQLYLALLAGALAVIALFGQEIVLWTAGPAFAGSARPLLIISLALGFEHLFGVYQYVFHLVKQTRWIFWFNLTYGGLMVTFVYAAARIGGINLVPWAVLAAVLTSNALRYVVAQRHLALPLPLPMLLAAALTLVAALALNACSAGWGWWPRIAVLGLGAAALAATQPGVRRRCRVLLSGLYRHPAGRGD